MKLKNIAFTLAETLVVMGIIGVIAALTIPNLSQSTGNKERIVKVKKVYSTLNEAIDRAQAVYGPIDEWFASDTTAAAQATRFGQRVTEFMKISKDCKTGTGCFANLEPLHQSIGNYDTTTNVYKVITADGTSLGFRLDDSKNPKVVVCIAKPNNAKADAIGKDWFFVILDSKDKLNMGNMAQFNTSTTFKASTKWHAGQWVLDYDNMDYLKVDANWKCPNGKVLNLTANPPVTSCN